MGEFEEQGLCRVSLHEGSELLAGRAQALHQRYGTSEDGIGGILALSAASKEGADAALSAVVKGLEDARKRLAGAEESLKAHLKLQAAAKEDVSRVRKELVPNMEPTIRDQESAACKQVEDGLAAGGATVCGLVEMEKALVKALEAAEKECRHVLKQAGEGLAKANRDAEAAETSAKHRNEVLKEAAKAVEECKPQEMALNRVLGKAKVNVAEVSKRMEDAEKELSSATGGWATLKGKLEGGLREKRKGYEQRFAAADFSAVTVDDLRTLLVKRGLGEHCDGITEKLKGPDLSIMLKQCIDAQMPFAARLQDVLRSGIKLSEDICVLKRVVHCLQLIPFGFGAEASDYSTAADDGKVGDGLRGRCCQWSEARVRMELEAVGVHLQAGQLKGVTGEVLLLLDLCSELGELGVTEYEMQRQIIDFSHEQRQLDPVGRLRLGLGRPVASQSQESVESEERLACYEGMAGALCKDGKPVLLPLGLVEEWTESFSEERLVGEGAFGRVYEGVITDGHAASGQGLGRLAVKQLSRDVSDGVKHHAMREINALSRFKHPNIIRLLGYTDFELSPVVCLVYEMGSRGSLGKMLRSDDRARQLTWRIRVRVASGLVAALNYLHCHERGNPVYHRDVKSDNVVLTADFQAKLIDCGLAKYKAGAGQSLAAGTVATTAGTPVGTALYCCPDYLTGEVPFDGKCEVFSVGVVLLELITGHVHCASPGGWRQYLQESHQKERRCGAR